MSAAAHRLQLMMHDRGIHHLQEKRDPLTLLLQGTMMKEEEAKTRAHLLHEAMIQEEAMTDQAITHLPGMTMTAEEAAIQVLLPAEVQVEVQAAEILPLQEVAHPQVVATAAQDHPAEVNPSQAIVVLNDIWIAHQFG